MSNFEKHIEDYLDRQKPCLILDAMKYALEGGKRFRPRIIFSIAKGFGIDEAEAYDAAMALEFIQTYSLIHDDLPAMDNDDLRRGKPTCHKQFDEATAILAGDGLLTYAFEEAAKTNAEPSLVLEGIRILSQMAGPEGMVYGQCLDMAEETGRTDWDALKRFISTRQDACSARL